VKNVKIHHLGIVITDLAETLQALGLDNTAIRETVFDPIQKNKLHFIYLEKNDLWLELVEPTDETASTYNFAKKFGMGLHHLGMGSNDLVASEKQYEEQESAFTLGRYHIEVNSFGGKIRTLFIAIKGLIIEFVKVEKDE